MALSFVYFGKAFGGAYMKSSVTQIERRFDIPSSIVGVIDGGFEVGEALVGLGMVSIPLLLPQHLAVSHQTLQFSGPQSDIPEYSCITANYGVGIRKQSLQLAHSFNSPFDKSNV